MKSNACECLNLLHKFIPPVAYAWNKSQLNSKQLFCLSWFFSEQREFKWLSGLLTPVVQISRRERLFEQRNAAGFTQWCLCMWPLYNTFSLYFCWIWFSFLYYVFFFNVKCFLELLWKWDASIHFPCCRVKSVFST